MESPAEYRIAQRIAHEMLQLSNTEIELYTYMGLGHCLGMAYEEITGRTCNDKTPRELIQWAINLPEVRYPHVTT